MIIVPAQTVDVISTNVDNGSEGKMFDDYLNSQTTYPDLIEVRIEFNNCDRVGLFNIDAKSIDFELTDNDTSAVVMTKTVDLEMTDGEYYQWVIEPIFIYADATLKISIHYLGGTAKCGKCSVGLSSYIGTTQYGSKPGFSDYSIKAINEFGQAYLLQGNWAKNNDIPLAVPTEITDAVYEDLAAVRGALCMFEGNENDSGYEVLRVFGYLQDWKLVLSGPTMCFAALTIKGVI